MPTDELRGTASLHLCTSAMLWASSAAEATSLAHVPAALLVTSCCTLHAVPSYMLLLQPLLQPLLFMS